MRPYVNVVTALVALGGLGAAQNPIPQTNHKVHQVAIVGAGAAGSSAAYYLRDFADKASLHVNITIFEKAGRIGGRTLTIDAYGDPSQPVELGASIFIQENYILYGALTEFNLTKQVSGGDFDPRLGIWDGDEFVFTIDQAQSAWRKMLQLVLKYGFLAPWRTQQLMQATIAKFLRLYDEPNFPFLSLTQRANELGLVEDTAVTGEQLLGVNQIDDHYAHDIVQARTRVNYASSLANIHGLDTMVAMAPIGPTAVRGGNWQIFQKMVEKSRAAVALNTTVVGLEFPRRQHGPSDHPKYALRTRSTTTPNHADMHPFVFDRVVLANPYQFSGISTEEGMLQHAIGEVPYVKLHVTIFASPYRYSPQFFGLSDLKDVPGGVLTTLSKTDNATIDAQGVGKAGFFSLTTMRTGVNPKTQKQEYIYKIFSPQKVTPEFLSRLFGAKVPNTFVAAGDNPESASPISWYYPHVFHAYPVPLPRVTFQDPVIGPGLYYTSGMESFISTMETNALMGKNVARLLVDDLLAASIAKPGNSTDELAAGGAQLILGRSCDKTGMGMSGRANG